MDIVKTINIVSSTSSLVIFLIAILFLVAIETRGVYHEKIRRLVADKIGFIGLVISGGALVLSIIYSNFLGYPPCSLCWWARIFLYPQILVFAFVLSNRYDRKTLLDTSIGLSILGVVFSGYHTLITYTGNEFIACGTTGSCTQRFVYEYGFVTIPLMALISFVAIIISSYYAKKSIS